VHITWIFGKDGANAGTEGTTQEDAYQAASNAWVTLMAGFTPVQSVGTPDDIRAYVRKQKQTGADLIKIFASKSIRQGGGMTLSQEQLNAACDEAKKQGLRTLVHAYKEAVRAATLAGCTEVEHGTLAP